MMRATCGCLLSILLVGLCINAVNGWNDGHWQKNKEHKDYDKHKEHDKVVKKKEITIYGKITWKHHGLKGAKVYAFDYSQKGPNAWLGEANTDHEGHYKIKFVPKKHYEGHEKYLTGDDKHQNWDDKHHDWDNKHHGRDDKHHDRDEGHEKYLTGDNKHQSWEHKHHDWDNKHHDHDNKHHDWDNKHRKDWGERHLEHQNWDDKHHGGEDKHYSWDEYPDVVIVAKYKGKTKKSGVYFNVKKDVQIDLDF